MLLGLDRVCDRCGWRYPYSSTRVEPNSGSVVCTECFDEVHPQDEPSRPKRELPIIKNPRGDISLITSVSWTPRMSVYIPNEIIASLGDDPLWEDTFEESFWDSIWA
jgi:hypothetical protein